MSRLAWYAFMGLRGLAGLAFFYWIVVPVHHALDGWGIIRWLVDVALGTLGGGIMLDSPVTYKDYLRYREDPHSVV